MLSLEQIFLRLVVAALLGSLVGLERERHDWVAGLRTHMMVCVGSAVAMIVSAYGFSEVITPELVILDPSRIAAQVVSGIGFLGAGTILYLRHNVIRGLTTAAGLWTVACIGLAIGSGLYEAGIVATVLAVVILALLKPLEKYVISRRRRRTFTLVVDESASIDIINQIFTQQGLKVVLLEIQQSDKSEENQIFVTLGKKIDETAWPTLLDRLRSVKGILRIDFKKGNLFR